MLSLPPEVSGRQTGKDKNDEESPASGGDKFDSCTAAG